MQPPETPNINCPVLAFYGDQDAGLMQSLPQLKADMEQHHKQFQAVVYPNTGHAFFNDTNPRTYNPQAAQNAWEKCLSSLKENIPVS